MKNYKNKIIIAIFVLVLMLAFGITLTSCVTVEEGGGTEQGGENIDSASNNLVVDITGLNYSEGTHFLIYDSVDFNKVVFVNEEYAGPKAYFDLYLNEEIVATVMYTSEGFPLYTFRQAGDYRIVATAGKSGAQRSSEFNLTVLGGGRPTNVDFHFENESGETLEKATAGTAFYVVADVYSDSNKVISNAKNVKCNWENDATLGTSFKRQFQFERSKVDKTASTCFNVICNNNVGKSVVQEFVFSFDVYNNLLVTDANPEGIYWSFGGSLAETGSALLNISAKEECGGYFAKKVTAELRYTDGYVEPLEVAYNDSNTETFEEGKVYIMIRYSGESDYSKYSTAKVGNNIGASSGRTYVKGEACYQFNPEYDSANLTLVYAQKADGDIKLTTVTNSIQFVDFEKTAVCGFAVRSVKNRTASAYFSTDLNKVVMNTAAPFFKDANLDVTDDTITVTVKRSATATNNHYFLPYPTFTDSGSYGDYYFTIENPEGSTIIKHSISYNNKNETVEGFIPMTTGTAKIVYESVYTDDTYTLTVVVEDSVLGYYLTTDGCPNYGYSLPDLTDYVVVNECRYSGAVTEVALKDFDSNKISSALSLSYNSADVSTLSPAQKAYKIKMAFTAKIDSGEDFDAIGYTNFFILPDYEVTLDFVTGELNSFSIADKAESFDWNLSTKFVSSGSLNFIGFVPTITVVHSVPHVAQDITILDGGIAPNYEFNIEFDELSCTYTVSAKCFKTADNLAYGFVPVMIIVVE